MRLTTIAVMWALILAAPIYILVRTLTGGVAPLPRESSTLVENRDGSITAWYCRAGSCYRKKIWTGED